MRQTVNTVSVDTQWGVRSFHLVSGDICESTDDIIVASSHANPEAPLDGAVLYALQTKFGCDFDQLRPLIVPRGLFGTYHLASASPNQPGVLVVRIPSAWSVEQKGGTPQDVLEEAFMTLYSSLAALEYQGASVRTVSMPIIAGHRDHPRRETITFLLRTALTWLRWSRVTEAVSVYVYQDDDFAEWYDEMDAVLGRKYFNSARDGIVVGLRQEISALLKTADRAGHMPESFAEVREGLTRELAEPNLRFQTIAMEGRRLAESMAQFLLDQVGVSCKAHLYEKIRRIRETKKVAPWVANYLLSLKDFGNEQVHIGGKVAYRPKEVTYDDLLALLCCLSQLVRIWLNWDSTPTEGKDS